MCEERILFTDQSTQGYSQMVSVPPGNTCNGWTVKNAGTTICIVNGEDVQPGDFKTFGQNRGEIYVGRIDLAFKLPNPAPAQIINQAFLTIKFYVKIGNKRKPNPTVEEYLSQ